MIKRRALLGAITAACSSLLVVTLTGASAASVSPASALNTRAHRLSRLTHCHAAHLAGSGGFLGSFSTVCQVASTVPPKGDVNPYGITVVPASVGDLTAGDVLVSNFNNARNLQGTGTTIVQISPDGASSVFANLARQTSDHLGLTTALSVLADGYVVVGSLPTTDGTPRTASAGVLYVLNSHGKLVETISGADVNGPWDMTSYDGGAFGALFITNVLNGTVAAGGARVHGGNVVRIVLDLTTSPPTVLQRVVIASGFAEKSDPNALLIGPTGLAIGPNGTVYVADTLGDRIVAIRDGLFCSTSAGTGTKVSSGGFLSGPLGLAIAPNGVLLSTNGGNGQIVESTLTGGQPEWPSVDNSGSEPGAGALFGLVVQPGGKGVYFVDDATNTLDIFN
jgi:sugar lactone lactonase YvrE